MRKSTLLKLITQIEDYDKIDGLNSSISIARDKTIGFLKQNSGLDNNRTIHEEMMLTFSPLLEVLARMRELEQLMAEYNALGDKFNYEKASNEYAQKSAYFEAREGYLIDVK